MTRRLTVGACFAVLALTATTAVASVDEPAERRVPATVRANPLTVELVLLSGPTRAGQQRPVQATVRNHGTTTLHDVVATLHLHEAPARIRDGASRDLGSLEGGRHSMVGWQVCVEEPGNYLVLVRIEAELDGRRFEAHSPAHVLQVLPPPGNRSSECRGS